MRGFATVLALSVIACGPPPRDRPGGDDDDDPTSDADINNDDGCADGTELVYIVDQFSNQLSRFDPATKTFADLGPLNCSVSGATPFSMSVSRDGNAWVLYNNGQLMRVSIATLTCSATAWASPQNLKVFGMGFSTDMAGGSTESLYIGGGADQSQTSFTLARVDTATLSATPIGTQPALPEMTGNGNAELWGFFPDAITPRVVQFDKTTGAIGTSYPLPSLAGTMTGYAFAHWGGDYWVFLIRNGESSSSVYQVNGMTGAITSTTPAPGRTIVGAGVSTCAPVVIF